ncbi:hypothetical protein ACF0H5_020150 [Mactra antiquata]
MGTISWIVLLFSISICAARFNVVYLSYGLSFPLLKSAVLGSRLLQSTEQSAENSDYLKITMHVFSGRRDPVWTIPSTFPTYQEILREVNAFNPSPFDSRLGYRGFTIDIYTAGELSSSKSVGNRQDVRLERLLLNTVESRVPDGDTHPLGDGVFQMVRHELP